MGAIKGKLIKGKVVALRPKTIVVELVTLKPHLIYKKIIKTIRKHHAHDEKMKAKLNDIVLIRSSRRRSKLKAFVLYKIIKTAI